MEAIIKRTRSQIFRYVLIVALSIHVNIVGIALVNAAESDFYLDSGKGLSFFPEDVQTIFTPGNLDVGLSQEDVLELQSLKSSIPLHDVPELNLKDVPEITENSIELIKEYIDWIERTQSRSSYDELVSSRLKISPTAPETFRPEKLRDLIDLNAGFAEARSNPDGNELLVGFALPSPILFGGSDERELGERFWATQAGLAILSYLTNGNNEISFFLNEGNLTDRGRYEIALQGTYQGIIIDSLKVRLVYYFNSAAHTWWLNEVKAFGLRSFVAVFDSPIWPDDQNRPRVHDVCLAIPIDGEQYSDVVISDSPETFYHCENDYCHAVYGVEVYFHDYPQSLESGDARPSMTRRCLVDAATFEVVQHTDVHDQRNSIKLDIFEMPYQTTPQGRIVPVKYAGITTTQNSNGIAASTNSNGEFTYNCTSCYVRPSSRNVPSRSSGFRTFTDNDEDPGNFDPGYSTLGWWNATSIPNKQYLFNTNSPYDDVSDHRERYIANQQVFFYLNWMHDAISPYVGTLQYKDAGQNNKQYIYRTGVGVGDSGGGRNINVDLVMGPTGLPTRPHHGSIFHEWSHCIDALTNTQTNEGNGEGPGCQHPRPASYSWYGDVRGEGITNAESYFLAKYPENVNGHMDDTIWNPASNITDHIKAVARTIMDIAWELSWADAISLSFGDDNLRSAGDTNRCNTTFPYTSGFAVPNTFSWSNNSTCACYDRSIGTSCYNGNQPCPLASTPSQVTYRATFGNQLSERGKYDLRFEVDKNFYHRTSEACPANGCEWYDDVTDRYWAGPMLEKQNAYALSGALNTLYWTPDPTTDVHYNGSSEANGLLSTKPLPCSTGNCADHDHLSFFAAYGETYEIRANRYGSAAMDTQLWVLDDASNTIAYNDDCTQGSLDSCITWTNTSMNYYFVRLREYYYRGERYYISFKMVGDDYPEYSQDSHPLSLNGPNSSAWTEGELETAADEDVFRMHVPRNTAGWYFVEVKHRAGYSGVNGRYRIQVSTTTTGGVVFDGDPTEANPIVICTDSANPKASSCLWDVMFNDNTRNYIYRAAENFTSATDVDWYHVYIPEGRRVAVSVVGLRQGTSGNWPDPRIELHSIQESTGGNGYYPDPSASIPILKASSDGWRVYVDGSGYSSSGNPFMVFTATRSQIYRIRVSTDASTAANSPYTLSVHVMRQSLSAPLLPTFN